jgi:DNA mismatch repair protein MutL
MHPIKETGCPTGTVIHVSDLFFNTPARKKHLKGPNTEAGHVSDVVNKFAMGYPHISFQLMVNGRLALKSPGKGDLLEAIACVYGINYAREMISVEAHTGDGALSGYISRPSLSRAGKSHQITFINGRFVRSWIISDAVEKAYHSMIMIGRHPVFVINLKVNPGDVDVNVHPAKTEVRLAEADRWGDFITAAAAKSLAGNRLIPGADLGIESRPKAVPEPKPDPKPEPEPASFHAQHSGPVEEAAQQVWPMSSVPAAAGLVSEAPAETDYTADPVKPRDIEMNTISQFPELRPIGQIDGTYIVAQGLDGMYLIDQHAAHERVLYEKFMEKPDEIVAGTQLLFPSSFQLTYQESQVLNDHIINFTDLGFVIEHFGGETFLLRAVPSGAAKNGGKEIFLDLLDYFSRNRHTISGKALREKVIITMACKSAIKANHKLGLPEMEALIGVLAGARQPYTCPHGRPTLIHFSGYELEKKFKRVV